MKNRSKLKLQTRKLVEQIVRYTMQDKKFDNELVELENYEQKLSDISKVSFSILL